MKKVILLLLFIYSSCWVKATWEPFGPDTVNANKVCFNLDYANHWAVCHNQGLLLYDHITQSWTNYQHTSNLPVVDASYLDGENILVIMGGGSNSDGIYTFDPQSGIFTLIQYLFFPHFIFHDETISKHYIGNINGLLSSPDGINWNSLPDFSARNITCMAGYQNHLVVSADDQQPNKWHSGDHGSSWEHTVDFPPFISNMGFDHEGKLYGVFPDNSYSSGLWSSNDYGMTWEVEFYSVNMNCMGFDAAANIYCGWGETGSGNYEGIARYDTSSGDLTFLNDGLPSLIVNQITYNPWMSAMVLFCATGEGAFQSFDLVGLHEQTPGTSNEILLDVYPNPAGSDIFLNCPKFSQSENFTVEINDLSGSSCYSKNYPCGNKTLNISTELIPAGTYLITLKTKNHRTSRTIILQ